MAVELAAEYQQNLIERAAMATGGLLVDAADIRRVYFDSERLSPGSFAQRMVKYVAIMGVLVSVGTFALVYTLSHHAPQFLDGFLVAASLTAATIVACTTVVLFGLEFYRLLIERDGLKTRAETEFLRDWARLEALVGSPEEESGSSGIADAIDYVSANDMLSSADLEIVYHCFDVRRRIQSRRAVSLSVIITASLELRLVTADLALEKAGHHGQSPV